MSRTGGNRNSEAVKRRTAFASPRRLRPNALREACDALAQQFEARAFAADGSADPEFIKCMAVLLARQPAAEKDRTVRLAVSMLMDIRFNQFAALGVLANMDDASVVRNIVKPAAAMGRVIEARAAEIAASIAPEARA